MLFIVLLILIVLTSINFIHINVNYFAQRFGKTINIFHVLLTLFMKSSLCLVASSSVDAGYTHCRKQNAKTLTFLLLLKY